MSTTLVVLAEKSEILCFLVNTLTCPLQSRGRSRAEIARMNFSLFVDIAQIYEKDQIISLYL